MPTRKLSAAEARTTTGATAPSAMDALINGASKAGASRSTTTATLTTLIAWARRRPNLMKMPSQRSFSAGKETAVTSSSGARSTLRKPVMKASSGRVRSPRSRLRTVMRASSANSGAIVSLAGLAVITLPTTVARLRICGAPTSQQARASGKAFSTIKGLATH
nr:hypothetical protein [Caldilinea sp.]